MAVQKSRKTPSKRGMHRSHDGLATPALSVDPQSGETHLRHCVTPDGFYRGKRVIEKPAETDEQCTKGSVFAERAHDAGDVVARLAVAAHHVDCDGLHAEVHPPLMKSAGAGINPDRRSRRASR